MVIDTISVSYDSMEELIDRQKIIEDHILDYIETKNIATGFESQVKISENRFYLTVNLIK